MGRLTPLITGKLVAFDTAPLIYYIEEHPEYLPLADELFDSLRQGRRSWNDQLTLHEVLVKPLRDGQPDLADRYREVLSNSGNVTIHVVDSSVCETAARMRAKYTWLRAPDALQIGTAIRRGAQIIVTNDERWSRLTEIEVAVFRELV